jgi:hypothetical protein
MSINYIENVFSDQELEILHDIINNRRIPTINKEEYISYDKNKGTGMHNSLGRLQIGDIAEKCPEGFLNKVTSIANSLSNEPLTISHAVYSEYNKKYGDPNLPPHVDRDSNDLIINFQLESNVSWDIGLGLNTYTIKDNSALIFNGNTNIHWRPHKTFKDEEYVKMIFFRFGKENNKSDYSDLPTMQDDSYFDEVRAFRDNQKS